MVAGGDRDGNRIRADQGGFGSEHRHRRRGVGKDAADHILLLGHPRVEGRHPEMVGVSDAHHAGAVLPGLVDGELHRPMSRDLAEGIVGVQQGHGAMIHLGRDRCRHFHHTGLDPLDVGFEPHDSVRIDSAQFGAQQGFRHDRRFVRREACLSQNVRTKRFHFLDGEHLCRCRHLLPIPPSGSHAAISSKRIYPTTRGYREAPGFLSGP